MVSLRHKRLTTSLPAHSTLLVSTVPMRARTKLENRPARECYFNAKNSKGEFGEAQENISILTEYGYPFSVPGHDCSALRPLRVWLCPEHICCSQIPYIRKHPHAMCVQTARHGSTCVERGIAYRVSDGDRLAH